MRSHVRRQSGNQQIIFQIALKSSGGKLSTGDIDKNRGVNTVASKHFIAFAKKIFQRQNRWLKVIDKLPDYRREDKFKSWLMVLARNKILDEYRALRRSNEKFTSIDSEEGGGVLDCYSIDTTPPDDGALDAWHLLQKCGSLLSLEQREVLYGRMAGDSFKEIARRQNVSINTVLARMQYAVKKIKKIFSDIEAVEGGKNE